MRRRCGHEDKACLGCSVLCTLLAFVLAAMLLSGCASVSVGPVGVLSGGLGYESAYMGAQAVATADDGAWTAEGRAAALTATKSGSIEGGAYSVQLLAGRRFGRFAALLGGQGGRQHASTWDKYVIQPSAAVRYQIGDVTYGVLASGPDSNGEIRAAYGMTLDTVRRRSRWPALSLTIEAVDWRQGANEGIGQRASAALLWTIR